MKKMALGIAMVVVAVSVFANVTLINLGHNVHAYRNVPDHYYYGEFDFSRLGIGPVFTFFVGRKNGFYAQLAPFLATGYVAEFPEGRWVHSYGFHDVPPFVPGGGLNLVLGYGRDINFGKMGILLGAGPFGSGYFLHYPGYPDWFLASLGVGAGAHYYFKPGSRRLVLNAGVDLAWRPLKVSDPDWGSYDGGPSIVPNEYNVNFNAGIGFRR